MDVLVAQDGLALRVTGDHSPHPVYLSAALAVALGGPEPAYHEIKRLARLFMLPRMGSESHPLTERDLRYARANEAAGARIWRWLKLEGPAVKTATGYDFIFGYCRREADALVFVDGGDTAVYEIPVEVD
jgi:hypothetical protein